MENGVLSKRRGICKAMCYVQAVPGMGNLAPRPLQRAATRWMGRHDPRAPLPVKFRDYCLNKCRDPDQIWMDLFHRPFRCRPFFSIAWWSILLNISLKRSHNPWHYGWFGLVVQTPQRVTWTFNAHFHHFSCLVDEQQRTGSAYKLRLMMRRPNRKYISRVAAAQRGGGYLMSIISLLVNAEGLPKPKNATSVQWWRLETWSIGQRTSL